MLILWRLNMKENLYVRNKIHVKCLHKTVVHVLLLYYCVLSREMKKKNINLVCPCHFNKSTFFNKSFYFSLCLEKKRIN